MSEERPAAPDGPRVVVLADDLIWATRLVDGVRRAGGEPVPARTAAAFDAALMGADGALVDLTARAYDGLDAFDVRDFMTPDPVVLRREDTLAVAVHKMAVGEFRHIPVVEDDGSPIGVVAAADVFRHIAAALG